MSTDLIPVLPPQRATSSYPLPMSLSSTRQRTLSGHFFFFFNDTATTEIYTLSLHDALPILLRDAQALPECGFLLGDHLRGDEVPDGHVPGAVRHRSHAGVARPVAGDAARQGAADRPAAPDLHRRPEARLPPLRKERLRRHATTSRRVVERKTPLRDAFARRFCVTPLRDASFCVTGVAAHPPEPGPNAPAWAARQPSAWAAAA